MRDYLIDFRNMSWESPAPGVRHKVYVKGNQRIRLAEFSDEFAEEDWCIKGHTGYVLEGSISIDFEGRMSTFRGGDGFLIPGGKGSRHKGKIVKGEKALIILFEKI